MSHDLRAPLRAMIGFSRILLEDCELDPSSKAHHYATLVCENGKEMARLIDALLAFSRLARQPLRREPVSPDALVREALGLLGAASLVPSVEITIQHLPPCEGDPTLLRQVFQNLLDNALKFTRGRDPARIEIGYRPNGDAPVYFVRDNGAGFDMRYADRLFGAFQRLHRTEEFEGSGIGLATVQRIVHRHGGRVWVEAEPERGATFFFTLS